MLIPLIAVLGTLTGMAIGIVAMPPMLAIAFGFIMNAVSPGIVVAQMLMLMSQGYGISNGEGAQWWARFRVGSSKWGSTHGSLANSSSTRGSSSNAS